MKTESIWMSETKTGHRETLPGDMETTVAVIGAGLAGILTAYYLQQAGLKVIVLEADRIGSGQTGNTTAKITSQHSLVYDSLIRAFGRQMAEHYAHANESAIREYEKLIRTKGIDCNFVRCPAFLYSRTDKALLKREAKAAASLGISASFGTFCELPFPVAGVTKFENQAMFQPLKFLMKMAEEITVYEKTKVMKAEDRQLKTDRGCVTAEHIIFATHFPFPNIPGYYFARMYQERSYIVALEGAGNPEGMYLGIDRDGLSFRSYENKLLLGGGSHRTGMNKKGGQYEMLFDKAQTLYPGCHETARWSAQDCMTLDGIPYIGRFSTRNPGWYVITGFGKWGMTTAMVGARILTSLITGQPCPEADIFSPQRPLTFRAAGEFAIHGAHTVKGLAKHLLPSGNKEIIPNCPHMGCRLERNPDEGSYDCPCHGSRFDKDGRLINGPAQIDCRKKGTERI